MDDHTTLRSRKPQAVPAEKLALLRALEKKVLWLSTWMIHNANHLRPSRDGLKVGGHQASSSSVATLMTALYLDVLRPQDRVAVKPHAAPVFHALQYLLGHQTRDKLERFRAFGGAQAYPSRSKDGDYRRFFDGLGRAWGRGDAVRVAGAGLLAASRDGAERRAARPDDRAGRRRGTRRGQHLRGVVRGLEARCPQSVVDHRLQPSESRRGCLRSAVRSNRRVVRVGRLARRHPQIRPQARGGVCAARRSTSARMDRRLPQFALLGAGLQRRGGVARAFAARPQPLSRHSRDPRRARRRRAARADDQSRRARYGSGARRLPQHHRRPPDLFHRLHDQGLRPAARGPQG